MTAETIRQLGLADVDVFRALRLEALRDFPASFGSSLETEQAYPLSVFANRLERATVIGACMNGEVVGNLSLLFDEAPNTAHRAWINAVYLQPAWRGKGFAAGMLEEALRVARETPGTLQVELYVSTTNDEAKALYERAGFVSQGTVRRALRIDGVFYDEQHMVLMLDG